MAWTRKLAAIALAAAVLTGAGHAVAEERLSYGEAVFVRECSKCHQTGPNAKNKIGPKLNGLFGRQAGAVEDFKNYSKANKEAGFTWTVETFTAYIRDPRATMVGTTQVYKGLKDEAAIAALIDYLKTK